MRKARLRMVHEEHVHALPARKATRDQGME